ncbi:MAG TPA: TraR/DksA C4-type zinc finger protein [Flavipsychrobacter sp.]|nr:TraR/DksA C4-type zinc finger protein [Flavipsychrobacter sp.]
MATKKKAAAKPVKNAKASKSGAKKAVNKKTAGKNAKNAASSKKAVAKNTKKVAVAKKPKAPAKKIVKKATSGSKTASAKKAVVTKKVALNKKSKPVNKKTSKTNPPKKAAQVKKAAPAVKKASAPVKSTASKTAVKKATPVKKAAPAKKVEPIKKAVPAKAVAKPEPKKAAPIAKKEVAKPTAKIATKHVMPAKSVSSSGRPLTASKPLPTATPRPTPTPSARNGRDDKKPAVIIAHRRLENKAKEADDAGKTMINYQPDYTRSILDQPEQTSGPVYRYSDEELNEFKELITGRLESARKELIYLQGLITRKDEAGTEDTENRYMNMEDGSGAMEREQLAQLASRQIQFISHLEKAIMRIENKTYGICRVTGKLIDKARLRAVPHATLSIEAKKLMGNKQQQQQQQ